jgi:hypothetical protein
LLPLLAVRMSGLMQGIRVRIMREKIGFISVDSIALGMPAQTFWPAKRHKRHYILPDGDIQSCSRLRARFLRRIRRPKRVVVILFSMSLGARACSRWRVKRAKGFVVALDWMIFRASTLVRLMRHVSERTNGINRLSCWSTHR